MKEVWLFAVATLKEGLRNKAHHLVPVSAIFSVVLSLYISLISLSVPEVTFAGFSLYFVKIITVGGMLFFMLSSLYSERRYKTYHIFLTVMRYPFFYIAGRFLGYNILFALVSAFYVAVVVLVGRLFFSIWLLNLFLYCITLDVLFFMISAVAILFYTIFSSSIVSIVLSFLAFIAGHFSFSYYLFAVRSGRFVWLYYFVPNVWLFSNEMELIHTNSSCLSVSSLVYGLSYGLAVLFVASLIFWNRRDF